jgi:hypothetical protein
MSMAVDLSTPLTKAEREYLAMRGRYDDITRADQMHGVEGVALPAGDGTGPITHGTATHDVALQRIAELEAQLALLRGGTPGADDSEEEVADDVAPYEEWTVAELDAELKRRNLAVTGNKESKVKVLYQDDETS